MGIRIGLGFAALFVLIQAVPLGREGGNPPVIQEPQWPSEKIRQVAVRACFDCHSNQTQWPWYASVAPVSWFVNDHVSEGRASLNFSEWNHPQEDADEAANMVTGWDMPPLYYRLAHPAARLTEEERQELGAALNAISETAGNDSEFGNDDD